MTAVRDRAANDAARVTGSRRRLRYRIALSFALGGLLLTTALAITTYGLIDRYLVRQRERTAEVQTYLNARAFRDGINAAGDDVLAALRGLDLPPGTSVVVHRDGTWYGTSVAIGRDAIPEELHDIVLAGAPAHQRTTVAGTTTFVIGLPIAAADAQYFEIALFNELDNSLAVVRNSLVGAAIVTTVGAALLGMWAGRRVLRPLTEVSVAASDIAGGRLDRRLDPSDDPDLMPLTESFNKMVDALQARVERDRRFASDVSHELRSPLTTLAAAASVLERRRDDLSDRVREPLELLVAEISRFQRLVVELLELSRAEFDTDGSQLGPVMLSELLAHAAGAAGCRGDLLEIDEDLTQRPVVTDKRRLGRIVANLLDNAMSYGDGVTRIEAAARSDGFTIAVEDGGPGVGDEEREQVFERFFRGRAAGRRGDGSGTGLGLALVAEHVGALGGRVWVEPVARGPGARFVVELPEGRL